MKKQIIAGLFITILSLPMLVFADSYDGPFCYEDPKVWEKAGAPDKNSQEYKNAEDWRKEMYDLDRESSKLRGTCKNLPINNVITLDSGIANDYLLAEHRGLLLECRKSYCEKAAYSEVIDFATSSSLYIPNWRNVALIDKKYTTDFINSIASDIKLYPQIVIINKDDLKLYGNNYEEYSLCDKMEGKETYYNAGDGRVCTYKAKEFSPHIIGIGNKSENGEYYSPKELQYAKSSDSKLLPNVGFVDWYGKPTNSEYDTNYVSITSPISSITNYWKFTKENKEIVLKWIKTEYILDDGSTKIATPNDRSSIAKQISKVMSTSTATATNFIPFPFEDHNNYNENTGGLVGSMKFIWQKLMSIFK